MSRPPIPSALIPLWYLLHQRSPLKLAKQSFESVLKGFPMFHPSAIMSLVGFSLWGFLVLSTDHTPVTPIFASIVRCCQVQGTRL